MIGYFQHVCAPFSILIKDAILILQKICESVLHQSTISMYVPSVNVLLLFPYQCHIAVNGNLDMDKFEIGCLSDAHQCELCARLCFVSDPCTKHIAAPILIDNNDAYISSIATHISTPTYVNTAPAPYNIGQQI